MEDLYLAFIARRVVNNRVAKIWVNVEQAGYCGKAYIATELFKQETFLDLKSAEQWARSWVNE